MKMKFKRVVLLLVPAILLTGCSGGASTPEAAFQGFKKGMIDKNYSAAFKYVTEESQEMMLTGVVFGASFLKMSSPENGEKVDAIFKKHGVDLESKSEKPLASVKDKGALLGDMLTLLESISGKSAENPMEEKMKNSTLTDVKIEGDKASGKVDSSDMHFVKVDGNWKIDMVADMKGQMGNMPSMDDMPSADSFELPAGPGSETSDPFESSNPFEADTPKPNEGSESPQPQ